MRFHHIAAIILAATLVGFVGCRKDREQGGVTYYPTAPVVVVPPAPPPVPPAPEYPPPPPAPQAAPPAAAPTAPAAQTATNPADPEVLTRGPLHEAFAEPVNYNPQPGIVAPRQPPATVEEMPPDEKPEGAAWIPGYWAWDDDRNDFIWVSGIWRVPPPNCNWVPGYWTQVAGGWQWTSGLWMGNQAREITYLPPPPASLELGPSSQPPSENYLWVTGCWNWSSARYVWRPGYWMAAQPSWVWIPAHYVWTPRGHVFVNGYWDYTIDNRGLVFAPVYFGPGVYAAPVYYSPAVVIDTGLLNVSLFTRPRYGYYYFGDYYAVEYANAGIYPWFEFHRYHTWYDPIYEHRRWSYRHDDPRWGARLRTRYVRLRDDPVLRPPRTLVAQRAAIGRVPEVQRKDLTLARPLPEVVANRAAPMKFEALDKSRREDIAKRANELEKYRAQRANWESPPATAKAAAKATAEARPTRLPAPPTTSPGAVAQPTVSRSGPTAVKPAGPPVKGTEPPLGPSREVKKPETLAPQPVGPKPPEVLPRQPREVRTPQPPITPPKEIKKPATPAPLPTGPRPPDVMPKQPREVRPPTPPLPPSPIKRPEAPAVAPRVIERPPASPTPPPVVRPPAAPTPAPMPRVIERPPAPSPPPVVRRPDLPAPAPAPRVIERPPAPSPPPVVRPPDPPRPAPAPRAVERPSLPSPPPTVRPADPPAQPRGGGPVGPVPPGQQPRETPRRG